MEENPICPNCGQGDDAYFIFRPPSKKQPHVLECVLCNVTFITQDHQPVHAQLR